MDSSMDGAAAVGEQTPWVPHQFMSVLAKNKNIAAKIDEMQERIIGLKKEHRKMLARHEKITEAANLLEFLCKIFQSANQKLRDGNPTRMKTEWGNIPSISEVQEDGLVTMLIERIQKMHIDSDGSKDFPQGMDSTSQQGDAIFERKKLLASELELGMQFSPSVLVLEDDLINQNKLLRMMTSDIREIEAKNTVMLCQWQACHNVLCGILDDVRMFNTQAARDCERVWYLCRFCKQLNTERLELIHQLM